MLNRTIFAALLLVFVAGCKPEPKHPPVQVDCAGSCAKAEDLHCKIAQPTKTGGSCVDACRNADDNGFPWNAACMTAAASCDVLENCE